MGEEILKEVDRKLHEEIHASMMRKDPASLLENPRLAVFSRIRPYIGELYGSVADVGCGSAYASIWIGINAPKVSRVDAIEGSAAAVTELIPRNIAYYDMDGKVNPVQGSFDNLTPGQYDFVVAFGALHHSTNLSITMESISASLKPGGYLIAQEPAMPDSTSHAQYQEKYDIVEERFGLNIRNGDRFDRFFRECEYKAAAIQAGMDIIFWEDWDAKDNPKRRILAAFQSMGRSLSNDGLSSTLQKIASKLKRNKSDKPLQQPWKLAMKRATQQVSSKLFVAQKTNNSTIYHRD